MLVASRLQVAAQKERQHLRGVDALAVGFREVARAVVVDDTGHAARLLRIAAVAFEFLDVGGDAQKLGQMSARGAAGDADPLRIDVVFGGVGPQKADGRLHIMHGGGKRIFRSETVADGDGHVALLGELHAQGVVARAVAGAEAAAMDAEDRGEGAIARLRTSHVQLQMLLVRIGSTRYPSRRPHWRAPAGAVWSGRKRDAGQEQDHDKADRSRRRSLFMQKFPRSSD